MINKASEGGLHGRAWPGDVFVITVKELGDDAADGAVRESAKPNLHQSEVVHLLHRCGLSANKRVDVQQETDPDASG